MHVEFHGAAGEVTGSCHLLEVAGRRILLDCGLFQGHYEQERRNRDPFPFDPATIDAVLLSHAHLDHSGRLPLLVKDGFRGRIHTQRACRDLCRIMLKDAAFLNERDAEWENRKRERKGLPPLEPLYTVAEARTAMTRFSAIDYDCRHRLATGIEFCLRDAGHILGSAIVELWLNENGRRCKLVYSGDLGHDGAPILRDVTPIADADLVLMESTYGNRLHRSRDQTLTELAGIVRDAARDHANILIPAFAVGRSQELLYLFGRHYDEWGLDRWQIFLDSPMAIEATEVYMRHSGLYDEEARRLWRDRRAQRLLPNLHLSRTAKQSMDLNRIRSGAIIIAGSGMCTGGRIRHHFKHNLWRENCHVVISGFQPQGTLGRRLVDGVEFVQLWGESVRVAARIHTVGGLSAHADRDGLRAWYGAFQGRPPVVLVHGEQQALDSLGEALRGDGAGTVHVAQSGARLDLCRSG